MLKDYREDYNVYIKSLEIGSHAIVWNPERVTCIVNGICRIGEKQNLTDKQIKNYFPDSDFVAEICENDVWYIVGVRI